MYFTAAPKRGRPSSECAREILDSVAASLAPTVADAVLVMLERQDGLEFGLRRDAEKERDDLLWILEVIDSPLYSAPFRERLVALFNDATTSSGVRATNIIQNANRYLATIAMMTVDTGWITDYPAFAAIHGELLTAAWQAATSESEEFRSAQFLARLRAALIERGLPESLFPLPRWMADELAHPAAGPSLGNHPACRTHAGPVEGTVSDPSVAWAASGPFAAARPESVRGRPGQKAAARPLVRAADGRPLRLLGPLRRRRG